MLLQQYEYEEAAVRGGQQLLHSPFFQVLIALACDLRFDRFDNCHLFLHYFGINERFIWIDLDYLFAPMTDHAGRGFEDIALQLEQLRDLCKGHDSRNHLRLMYVQVWFFLNWAVTQLQRKWKTILNKSDLLGNIFRWREKFQKFKMTAQTWERIMRMQSYLVTNTINNCCNGWTGIIVDFLFPKCNAI